MAGRHWLVRAFPRSWRARFGDELGHLLDDMAHESGRIAAKDLLDVARAGLAERLRALGQHRRALVRGCVALSVVVAGAFATLEVASRPSAPVVSPPTTSTPTTMTTTTAPTQPQVSTQGPGAGPSPTRTTRRDVRARAAAQAAAARVVAQEVAAQAAADARAADEATARASTASATGERGG